MKNHVKTAQHNYTAVTFVDGEMPHITKQFNRKRFNIMLVPNDNYRYESLTAVQAFLLTLMNRQDIFLTWDNTKGYCILRSPLRNEIVENDVLDTLLDFDMLQYNEETASYDLTSLGKRVAELYVTLERFIPSDMKTTMTMLSNRWAVPST